MARYAAPGTDGSVVTFKPRYDHFIGGEYVAPKKGQYFENPTPVTGETFTEVARGTAEDVEAALDAAHAAAPAWGKTSAAERAPIADANPAPAITSGTAASASCKANALAWLKPSP